MGQQKVVAGISALQAVMLPMPRPAPPTLLPVLSLVLENETFSLTSNNELAKEQQQSIRPPKSCCMLEIQQFDATKTLYMNCFDWKKTLKTLLEIG